MARRNRSKRPFAPGAGQDAGRRRQQDPGPAAERSFKGRQNAGGQLHKRGQGTGKRDAPKITPRSTKLPRLITREDSIGAFVLTITPAPKPQAPKIDAAEVDNFTRAAARRALNGFPSHRERAIELGLIRPAKEV